MYRLFTVIKPLFCHLCVDGAEHVPSAGGCVIACNHNLGPDYVLLGYGAPRQIYFMAKEEIFTWNPLLSRVFRSVGTFPIRRGKGDAEALQNAIRVLHEGHVVGMFPEGTRSPSGKLLRGKSGAARIAMLAEVPVVPAVVINSSAVLPTFLKVRRRPMVTIRFGPPLAMNGNPESLSDARANTERIMQAIAALLPPELRGLYAEKGGLNEVDVGEEMEGE